MNGLPRFANMTEYTRIPIRDAEHQRLVQLQHELTGKISSYLSRPSLSDVIKHLLDREELKTMNTTVLLRHRTSGDVFAAKLDSTGKVTKSVGPLHYSDYTAALAGQGDANMTTEDNDWLNENDFVQWTPPQSE